MRYFYMGNPGSESQPLNLSADLTEIMAVWPELPEHIKVANKALVQAHKHKLE